MSAAQQQDLEDLVLQHAVTAHGLEWKRCTTCVGVGCSACGGEGVLFVADLTPCGEGCPLDGFREWIDHRRCN